MEAASTRGGYDDSICQTEVPDFCFCVVCHLIVRKSVQILKCGHKMCSSCFESYQTYTFNNSDRGLVCPVDQRDITPEDVVPDVGTDRFVGNLRVVCVNSDNKCLWVGDLRDMKAHLDKGDCCAKDEIKEKSSDPAVLRELKLQLDMLEKKFSVKCKENDVLKREMTDLREKHVELQESYLSLEARFNMTIQTELVTLKEQVGQLLSGNMKSPPPLEEADLFSSCISQTSQPPATKKKSGLTSSIATKPISRVYLDIDIGGKRVGRVMINLLVDQAPQICENFIKLCMNEIGKGYKGSLFHSVHETCCNAGKNLVAACDLPQKFATRRKNMKYESLRGEVGMLEDNGVIKSEFSVYLQPAWWVNGFVLFGHVSEDSMRVLEKICQVPTDSDWKPTRQVKIRECGVLP